MLGPALLGKLRTTRLWPRLKAVHATVGPFVCGVIHSAVGVLPKSWVPTDLALKHRYDFTVIQLPPTSIERSLRAGEWGRAHDGTRHWGPSRWRQWRKLGGSWKHLQRHVSRNFHGRFIADGDWDLKYKPFKMRASIDDLFVQGLQPHETKEYRKLVSWIEAGEFGWTRGFRTIADVDRYFDELIDLYVTIRDHGYRTQIELDNDGADEIRVCIDRDGRPCVIDGGTHRLSIARLLELPSVPVIVKRVHLRWVERCSDRYTTSDVQEAIDYGLAELGHPDFEWQHH